MEQQIRAKLLAAAYAAVAELGAQKALDMLAEITQQIRSDLWKS